MRAHDQTDVRRRRLAGAWLLALAAATASTALGREAPIASWKGDPGDPIRLVAERVQTWDDGGEEWVFLEDRLELAQGTSRSSPTGPCRGSRGPGEGPARLIGSSFMSRGMSAIPATPGSSSPRSGPP